jgi:hypothetical protein
MKIIQTPQIETAIQGDIMAVKIPKEMMIAKEDWQFFLDLQQTKRLKIRSLDFKALRNNRDLRRYIYYDGDQKGLQQLTTKGPPEPEFMDQLEKYQKLDSLEVLRDPSFDPQRLVYLWSDAYLWYGFRNDLPLSPTYHVGYIGGITNQDYNLDKAEAILKKKKWTSDIKRTEIPYYNQGSDHTHAIEFSVQLPQKEHDKIVRYYRDEMKEEFWSCRVKDCLASAYSLEPFNILGLKAALKGKK